MTAPPHGQPCVLLVDDNPLLRDQLVELLPEFGIQVAGTAGSGEESLPAIAAARGAGTPPDVVLMDVRMPGIGGLEATRQVRAAHPHVRVLLYTAFAGQMDDLARHVGAFGEVSKTAGVQELVDRIWDAHSTPPAPVSRPAAAP